MPTGNQRAITKMPTVTMTIPGGVSITLPVPVSVSLANALTASISNWSTMWAGAPTNIGQYQVVNKVQLSGRFRMAACCVQGDGNVNGTAIVSQVVGPGRWLAITNFNVIHYSGGLIHIVRSTTPGVGGVEQLLAPIDCSAGVQVASCGNPPEFVIDNTAGLVNAYLLFKAPQGRAGAVNNNAIGRYFSAAACGWLY